MEPPPIPTFSVTSVTSVVRTLVSVISSFLVISWARVSPSLSGAGASIPSPLVGVVLPFVGVVVFSYRGPGLFLSVFFLVSLVSWVVPLVAVGVFRSICIFQSLVSS